MPFALDGYVPATGQQAGSAFYNAVRDAPVDATVPELVEDTRDLVREFLDLNQTFALDAIDDAHTVLQALAEAHLPPDLPSPPPAPTIITQFNAGLGIDFDPPVSLGDLQPQSIEEFNPADVTIPSINSDAPVYQSLGLALNIPDSPNYIEPTEPTAPSIETDFTVPDAPTKDYGGSPDLDEIVLPVYVAPTLPVFNDDAPEFDTLPPNPIIQWSEPAYLSDIKDAVEDVITAMLAGGTGLPAGVEQAIWDRGREREDSGARSVIDQAISEWAARNFDHPQGQLDAKLLMVGEETQRKVNGLSREILIAQADLEQKNRQFAVTSAISYEQVFTALFLAVVDRNFQIAKFAVETQIQVYNLLVTAFNVEQQVFAQKIAKYRAELDGALFYLQAFKALVDVERAKAEMNTAKVQAYSERVKAYSAQVDAYKALIQAAGVRADLQKNKVDIFKSQVDAMVGKINGQRARFEAYGSRIQAETAKVSMEDANARVYGTTVQAWGVKADKLFKEADVELQTNRQTLEWNVANMQRVTAFTGQQLNAIQANLAVYQAETQRGTARYSADVTSAQADLQANVSLSQLAIAKYQALLEQWKVRSQEVIQFGLATIESMRTSAQVTATMVSGAMAGTHVSAGISAGASVGQSSARSATSSSSQTQNVNESSQYAVSHNYQHRV